MNMDWSETPGPQINDTVWRILQNTNEVLSTVCAVPTASSSDREGVNRPCASAHERIGPTQEDEGIPTRMDEENEETQDPGKCCPRVNIFLRRLFKYLPRIFKASTFCVHTNNHRPN